MSPRLLLIGAQRNEPQGDHLKRSDLAVADVYLKRAAGELKVGVIVKQWPIAVRENIVWHYSGGIKKHAPTSILI